MKRAVWPRFTLCTLSGYLECRLQLTLSQTSPSFYVSERQVYWKHCGKKEKLLMSNFSFSHSVFYPFGELSVMFIKFKTKIVVCKLFHLGRV